MEKITAALPSLPATLPSLGSLSTASSATANVATFGDLIARHLGQVNDTQRAANEAVQQLVSGQSDEIHETVLKMSQADLAFRMVVEVRNRLIDSYQELMRMQV